MLSLPIAYRISTIFAALFSVSALILPYFPLFLQHRGLSDQQIGTILAAMTMLRLFIGPLGALADRSGDRRPIFITYSALTLSSILIFHWADGYVGLLLASIMMVLFWNPLGPILEAVAAMHASRGAGDFGRMRSFGSAMFVCVTVFAGWFLNGRSGEWVMVLIGIGLTCVVTAGFLLPPLARGTTTGLGRRTRYKDLLHVPGLLIVLVVASIVHGSHQMFYGFGSIYWKAQGFPDGLIGVFWSMGVLSEVIMFTWSAKLSRFLKPNQWLLIGCATTILRWVCFPFVTSAAGWMALQCLHGLTFGATHIGAVTYIVRNVRERQAVSAQSLYATLNAVMSSIVSVISGSLYAAYGGTGFGIMALMAMTSLVIAVVYQAGAGAKVRQG